MNKLNKLFRRKKARENIAKEGELFTTWPGEEVWQVSLHAAQLYDQRRALQVKYTLTHKPINFFSEGSNPNVKRVNFQILGSGLEKLIPKQEVIPGHSKRQWNKLYVNNVQGIFVVIYMTELTKLMITLELNFLYVIFLFSYQSYNDFVDNIYCSRFTICSTYFTVVSKRHTSRTLDGRSLCASVRHSVKCSSWEFCAASECCSLSWWQSLKQAEREQASSKFAP